MKTKSILASTAISSLLALAAISVSTSSLAADDNADKEKCYGVAKAGENSCAANGHSCQGQSKADSDPAEWKYVAKGECKTMGGSMEAGKKPT